MLRNEMGQYVRRGKLFCLNGVLMLLSFPPGKMMSFTVLNHEKPTFELIKTQGRTKVR